MEKKKEELLTVRNDEQINSQHGESFSDAVVRVLKFPLHYSCVDLHHYDPSETRQNHSVLRVRNLFFHIILYRGKAQDGTKLTFFGPTGP